MAADQTMSVGSRRFTPQQDQAIRTRDVSIGLSAGAGCGKTFVLTERFITHIEPGSDGNGRTRPDPFSSVVAITFTERAAREMRDRVRLACAQRLRDCTESDVDHWLAIFRRIDGARISTIHSFCASFLRRHAVAAGVDPRFRLLEDESGDAVTRLSIADTVRRLLERQDENCLRLVAAHGLERTRHLLRSLLNGRATIDTTRFAARGSAETQAAWTEHLQTVFLPALIRELGQSELAARLIGALNSSDVSNATMRQRCLSVAEGLEKLRTDNSPPVAFLTELRESARVQGGGGAKCWQSEESYETVKTGFEKFRKEIDSIVECSEISEAQVAEAAELTAAAADVMQHVAADYDGAKAIHGLLDFDDLLVRTRDLLRGSEAVRKEAAGSIAALLVDEFQDTDPVQAEIVQALIGGDVESGKLFVVGDVKQSIYRFRRADPAVFEDMRAKIPPTGRLPLTVNFRSQPQILHFVNAVFAPALKETYEPLNPFLKQESPTPCIEFLFAVPEAGSDEPDRADPLRRREADWMARRIDELLNDPTPRVTEKDPETGQVHLRPVRAGDIAVLFRALSNVAIYEDAFRRRGVDYYLFGGRAFFAQQEINDVVNLCAFLNDPDDEIGLAGVLRSPFFSLSDETLFWLADGGSRSLRAGLTAAVSPQITESQRDQVRQAARVLDELQRNKDRMPLAELLELAVERTGYDASQLHEFLGRRKIANLRKLIEMARQFDRSGFGTLADFAIRIRESVNEETDEELAATHPEASNVVRLMTIHQSKGLEFPVVIVADMDRNRRNPSANAVYHCDFGPLLPLPHFGSERPRHLALEMHRHVEGREDEQESLRILYVAMTRAANTLILSSGLSATRQPRGPWLKLIAERFHLGTGLPNGDPYFGILPNGKPASGEIPEIRVHLEPPKLRTVPRPASRPAPLSKFREIAENGEASPLPRLMQPVPAQHGARSQFSVSAIELADAQLRGGSRGRLPEALDHSNAPPKPIDADRHSEGSDDATLLGTVVHAVIERLEVGHSGKIDKVVASIVKGLSPVETDGVTAESVKKRIRVFLGSPLWSEISSAKRNLREVDFLLSWPPAANDAEQAIIAGKLDCLLQMQDGAWKIIDYKTGRLSHSDPVAVLDQFAIQLVLYAEAVRGMTGSRPSEIEIAVLGDEITRIPLKLWDEFYRKVHARIDAAIARLKEPVKQQAAAAL